MSLHFDKIGMDKISSHKIQPLELSGIAQNSALVFISRIGGTFLQFIYNLLLARHFGPNFVGLFAFALSLINIAATLGQVGTQQTLVRYIPIYRSKQIAALLRALIFFAFSLGILGSLITSGLLFYYRNDIESLTQKSELASMLYILAPVILPLTVIQMASYALQGAKKVIQYTSIRELGLPTTILIAALTVLMFNSSYVGFLNIYFIGSMILGLISIITVWHEFRELKTETFQNANREWFMFSIPNAGISVLQTGTAWYETIILSLFRPAEEVGVFFVALRTGLLVNIVLVATNTILTPLIAEMWSNGQVSKLQYIYRTTTRWCFMISIPIVISMLITRTELMLLFGPEFAFGGTVLATLLIGRLINSTTGGVAQLLIMTGGQRIELINVLVHAFLIAVSTYWAAKYYGIVGVAITNSVVVGMMNLIKLLQVWYRLRIQPYDKSYLYSSLSATVAAVVGYIVHTYLSFLPIVLVLLLSFLLVVFTYVIVLSMLSLPSEDRIVIQSLKNKVFLSDKF